MPSRLYLFFATLVAFFALAGIPTRGQNLERPGLEAKDIDSTLETQWFGIYLKNKKIGYSQSLRDRAGDLIREKSTYHMKLLSFGLKAEVAVVQSLYFEAKAPFRLVKGELEKKDDSSTSRTLLTRTDKGFETAVRVGKEQVKKELEPIDYTLADSLAAELWVRRQPKRGATINFRQFDLLDLKVTTMTTKVLGSKTSLVGGVPIRYYELENENNKDRLKFLTRHDDQGRTLSSQVAIFEFRLETEEQAKNTEYSQDLFVLGMVKIDRALGPTKKVAELVLRVDGKEAEIFEDGPRQSVTARPDGSRIVKLGKKHGKEAKATAKEIEECLAETTVYNISHPKVKALANKVVGDAKTPEDKVQRIVDFAYEFVQPNLSAAMPNIHDLMDKKRGDCKSYALLVTTLARATRVPAREVSGLLYVGDDQKAFGGHAWNEVVLGGVWVPVDGSLRQTEVDATHVSFGSDSKATANLLTTLGKLSFKVVEVKGAK